MSFGSDAMVGKKLCQSNGLAEIPTFLSLKCRDSPSKTIKIQNADKSVGEVSGFIYWNYGLCIGLHAPTQAVQLGGCQQAFLEFVGLCVHQNPNHVQHPNYEQFAW